MKLSLSSSRRVLRGDMATVTELAQWLIGSMGWTAVAVSPCSVTMTKARLGREERREIVAGGPLRIGDR